MRMFGLQIAGQKEMAVGLFVQLVGAEKRFELEMVAQKQLVAVEPRVMVIPTVRSPEMVKAAQPQLAVELLDEMVKLVTEIQ